MQATRLLWRFFLFVGLLVCFRAWSQTNNAPVLTAGEDAVTIQEDALTASMPNTADQSVGAMGTATDADPGTTVGRAVKGVKNDIGGTVVGQWVYRSGTTETEVVPKLLMDAGGFVFFRANTAIEHVHTDGITDSSQLLHIEVCAWDGSNMAAAGSLATDYTTQNPPDSPYSQDEYILFLRINSVNDRPVLPAVDISDTHTEDNLPSAVLSRQAGSIGTPTDVDGETICRVVITLTNRIKTTQVGAWMYNDGTNDHPLTQNLLLEDEWSVFFVPTATALVDANTDGLSITQKPCVEVKAWDGSDGQVAGTHVTDTTTDAYSVDSVSFYLEITGVNDPPSWDIDASSLTASFTEGEGASLGAILFSVGDALTPGVSIRDKDAGGANPMTQTWTITITTAQVTASLNGAPLTVGKWEFFDTAVPTNDTEAAAGATYASGTMRGIRFVPASSDANSLGANVTATLTVSDGTDESPPISLQYTILPQNDAPTVTPTTTVEVRQTEFTDEVRIPVAEAVTFCPGNCDDAFEAGQPHDVVAGTTAPTPLPATEMLNLLHYIVFGTDGYLSKDGDNFVVALSERGVESFSIQFGVLLEEPTAALTSAYGTSPSSTMQFPATLILNFEDNVSPRIYDLTTDHDVSVNTPGISFSVREEQVTVNSGVTLVDKTADRSFAIPVDNLTVANDVGGIPRNAVVSIDVARYLVTDRSYAVLLPDGFFSDGEGNRFDAQKPIPSIISPEASTTQTFWAFSTENSENNTSDYKYSLPLDGAQGASNSTSVVFVFDEPISSVASLSFQITGITFTDPDTSAAVNASNVVTSAPVVDGSELIVQITSFGYYSETRTVFPDDCQIAISFSYGTPATTDTIRFTTGSAPALLFTPPSSAGNTVLEVGVDYMPSGTDILEVSDSLSITLCYEHTADTSVVREIAFAAADLVFSRSGGSIIKFSFPVLHLSGGLNYTLTVPEGFLYGTHTGIINKEAVFAFGGLADGIPPIHLTTLPDPSSPLPLDTSRVEIHFNEPVAGIANIQFQLSLNGTVSPVLVTPSYQSDSGNTVVDLSITGDLQGSGSYTIILPSSIVDLSGNALEERRLSFNSEADNVAPLPVGRLNMQYAYGGTHVGGTDYHHKYTPFEDFGDIELSFNEAVRAPADLTRDANTPILGIFLKSELLSGGNPNTRGNQCLSGDLVHTASNRSALSFYRVFGVGGIALTTDNTADISFRLSEEDGLVLNGSTGDYTHGEEYCICLNGVSGTTENALVTDFSNNKPAISDLDLLSFTTQLAPPSFAAAQDVVALDGAPVPDGGNALPLTPTNYSFGPLEWYIFDSAAHYIPTLEVQSYLPAAPHHLVTLFQPTYRQLGLDFRSDATENTNLMGVYSYYVRCATGGALASRRRSAFARVEVTVIGSNEIKLESLSGGDSSVSDPDSYYIPSGVGHRVRVDMLTVYPPDLMPDSSAPNNNTATGSNAAYNQYEITWTADYGLSSGRDTERSYSVRGVSFDPTNTPYVDRIFSTPFTYTITNTYTGASHSIVRTFNTSNSGAFDLWFQSRTGRTGQESTVCRNSGLQSFVSGVGDDGSFNLGGDTFRNLDLVGAVVRMPVGELCCNTHGSCLPPGPPDSQQGTVLCGTLTPIDWAMDTTGVPVGTYRIQRNSQVGTSALFGSGIAEVRVVAPPSFVFSGFEDKYCSADDRQHPLVIVDQISGTRLATDARPGSTPMSGVVVIRLRDDAELFRGTPADLGDDLFSPSRIYTHALTQVEGTVSYIEFTIEYFSADAEDPTNGCSGLISADFTIYGNPTVPTLSPHAAYTRSGDTYTGSFCSSNSFPAVSVEEDTPPGAFQYRWYRDGDNADVTSAQATGTYAENFTPVRSGGDFSATTAVTTYTNHFTRVQYADESFAGCESPRATLITQSLANPEASDSEFMNDITRRPFVMPTCVNLPDNEIVVSTTHFWDHFRYDDNDDYSIVYDIIYEDNLVCSTRAFTAADREVPGFRHIHTPLKILSDGTSMGIVSKALGVDSSFDLSTLTEELAFYLEAEIRHTLGTATCSTTFRIGSPIVVAPLPGIEVEDFEAQHCEQTGGVDLQVTVDSRVTGGTQTRVDWANGANEGTFSLQYRDASDVLQDLPTGTYFTPSGDLDLLAALSLLRGSSVISDGYGEVGFRLFFQNDPFQASISSCVGEGHVDFVVYELPEAPTLDDTQSVLLYCEGDDSLGNIVLSEAPDRSRGEYYSWYANAVGPTNLLASQVFDTTFVPANLALDRDLPGNAVDSYRYLVTHTQNDASVSTPDASFRGCTSPPTEVFARVISRPDVVLDVPPTVCVGRVVEAPDAPGLDPDNNLRREENMLNSVVRARRLNVWHSSSYSVSGTGLVGGTASGDVNFTDAPDVSLTAYGNRSSSTPGAVAEEIEWSYSPFEAVRGADPTVTDPGDSFSNEDERYLFTISYQHENVYDTKRCPVVLEEEVRVLPLPDVSFGIRGDSDFGVNKTQLEKQVCVFDRPFTLTGEPLGGRRSFVVNEVAGGTTQSFRPFDPDVERRSATEAYFADPSRGAERSDFIDLVAAFEGAGDRYYRFHDNTVHYVSYRHADAQGCENFFSKRIIVNSLPLIDFSPIYGCADRDISFSAVVHSEDNLRSFHSFSGTVITRYSWNFGDPASDGDPSNPNLQEGTNPVGLHSYGGGSGEYDVALEATTYRGCTNTHTTTVVLGKSPAPVFYWSGLVEDKETIFHLGDSGHEVYEANIHEHISIGRVSIVLSDEGAQEIDRLVRERTDTNGDGLVTTEDDVPSDMFSPHSYSFPEPGTYTAEVSMSTVYGCEKAASRVVKILPHIEVSSSYENSFEDDEHGWFAEYTRAHEDGLERFSGEPLPSSWEVADPRGVALTSASDGQRAWVTNATGSVSNEKSWIYSPEFDITTLSRPMVDFDIAWSLETRRNGVVLQYSTDNGAVWYTLGNYRDGVSTGLNWYDHSGIASDPGNQFSVPDPMKRTVEVGWAGSSEASSVWKNARHKLDVVPEDERASVRFRFALATDSTSLPEGVVIDHFKIRERKRGVLLEEFASELSLDSKTFHEEIRSILSGAQEDILIDPSLIGTEGADILHLAYYIYSDESSPADQGVTIDRLHSISPAEFSARALYYGISSVPSSVLVGTFSLVYDAGGTTEDVGWTVNDLNVESLLDPLVEITLRPIEANSDEEIAFNVLVSFPSDASLRGPHHLYILLVEGEVTLPGINGQENFHNVVRKVVPSGAGIPYTLPSEGIQEDVRFGLLPGVVNDVDKAFVVVYFQNDATGAVYQAVQMEVGDLNISDSLATQPEAALFSLYPNPADDRLSIRFSQRPAEDLTVRIFDVLGRLVSQQQLAPQHNEDHLLPLSHVPEGVYCVWVRQGQSTETRRLIIRRSR